MSSVRVPGPVIARAINRLAGFFSATSVRFRTYLNVSPYFVIGRN
jgi:hypothetical protein